MPLTDLTQDESHPGKTGSAESFSHSIVLRKRNGGARQVRFTQCAATPCELAAVRHHFNCSSYFAEVFQTCASVNTNDAMNTSMPLACQTRCEKASSLTCAGAINLSFQGLKQTQRYQRASLLGIHQQAAVPLPPASGGWQRAALSLLVFVRQAAVAA